MNMTAVKSARWGGDCGGDEDWEVGWRWAAKGGRCGGEEEVVRGVGRK